jgi:hypothetical protein
MKGIAGIMDTSIQEYELGINAFGKGATAEDPNRPKS